EQVAVDRRHLQRGRLDRLHLGAQVVGVRLDQGVVLGRIQARVLVAGDQEGGRQQGQRRVIQRCQGVPVGKLDVRFPHVAKTGGRGGHNQARTPRFATRRR